MIDQFKSILIDDWKIGKQTNLLNSLLDKKARSGFRNKIIKSRHLNNIEHYSDIEKINLSSHNLDMNLIFVEAAHIFDVWCIKKIVVEHKRNDIKDDDIVINLLNALDDPSNALLLPFNYHKLFDMNLKGCAMWKKLREIFLKKKCDNIEKSKDDQKPTFSLYLESIKETLDKFQIS